MAALQAVSLQSAASASASRRARSFLPRCTSSPSSLSLSPSPLKALTAQVLKGPRTASSSRRLLRSARAVASPPEAPEADPKAEQLEKILKNSPGSATSSPKLPKAGSAASGHASELQAEAPKYTVWGSDVVASPKRPYFLNREWSSKDIQYAVYMLGIHGLCLAAPFTFSWNAFGVFTLMYIITGMFGITLSYHRQLSHKSFVTPKWLEYAFAYCGVLAIQGSPMEWVSAHRFHHRHCDTEEDPHTPYEGFWHSHMGWLLDDKATSERVGVRSNIADMQNDPFYIFIEETYIWHIAAMAVVLYAAGGFPFIVWGLAVRAVWVYHITWFVNSAAHVWGYQSWNTGDLSRNNWWVAILAFGEGWHNNHHAFEYSARHGLEWWQYDPTWYTVKLLEVLGLAKKVRYPTPDHMAKLAFPSASADN